MWDEEGLEPLRGTATNTTITTNNNTTRHLGSFDSDLNSIVSFKDKLSDTVDSRDSLKVHFVLCGEFFFLVEQ